MVDRLTDRGSNAADGNRRRWSPIYRWGQMGLTGRMFLVVIIAVLPALAIQAVNEYMLKAAGVEDTRQRVIQITKQFGEEMKEVREGASQLLLALGEFDEIQDYNVQACEPILTSLKSRFDAYAQLGAADLNGRVFCSSGAVGSTSVADTEFFKRAMQNDKLAVGNYFVDPVSHEKMIHFAHQFRDNAGKLAGVVFAGLNLDWLSEHLKERGLTPSQSILIADRLGNIIARLPHPEQLVGKNMRKSHEDIMDGNVAGWHEAKGVDGIMRIFGYVPMALPPFDFFLSAGQEKAVALEPIDAAAKRGLTLILLGLFAAMYLAWLGGRRFIKRPIAELLEGTVEWGKGNHDARVVVDDPHTEIGRLGLAFNDMAEALAARYAAQQRAEEELRHLNATLESRIERRTLELEEANRAKSQFLAKMSHEIRTPVNGILGMLELVCQTRLEPRQQRYIATARRSAEILLGIIGEILDISKIEAGKIELEQTKFDLRGVVEEVAETFADPAEARGLELTFSIPPHLPTALIGDPGRLRQILMNLISNALKFTERGEVKISVEPVAIDDGSAFVAFAVSDTGIGIPADKQQHIFDAFAQADSSTTRRYGGTGLGLSIAKQLCEMMGGTIEVTSEPGHGSTFRFTARFGRVSAETEATGFEGMTVLLVESNIRRRTAPKNHLLAWGVRVIDAANADTALAEIAAAAARGEPFTLAIIDTVLPGVDGVDLARKIKADPATADLRLAFLTSHDHEANEIGDLREQVVGCLARPVRQSVLRACLAGGDGAAVPISPRVSSPSSIGADAAPVLLVEDNPVNLEVAVGILESFGCTVETATDGKQAVERYANGELSLIFMDCQMPVLDGFEATGEIRKLEGRSDRHIPIVALTASAIEGDREQCLNAGMDDYVTKPFTAEQMKSVLANWLGGSPRRLLGNCKREHLTLVARQRPEPPPPRRSTDEPIDDRVLDVLAGLQQAGRPGIVSRVISLFLQSAPVLVRDLQAAAESGDTALLHRTSHTLKSASANVGAAVLAAHCKELEALARSGPVSDAGYRVATIVEDYRLAEAALTARLPKVA